MKKLLLTVLFSVLYSATFAAPGDLDTTFGVSGGYVVTDFSGQQLYSTARDIAVQADGKIVIAGWQDIPNTSNHSLCTQQMRDDGSVDTTFNYNAPNGKITHGFTAIEAIAALPNGKIIVAGYGSDGTSDYIAVERRLSTNLTGDATFGTSGLAKTDLSTTLNDRASGLFVQTDNKIVVSATGANAGGDTDFAVVRYTANGALDLNRSEDFGSSGISMIDFGTNNNDQATALLVDAAGAMIVGGATNPANGERFALTKLNFDGSVRLSFGTLGRAIDAFTE